jgi:hypothetical protein
VLAYFTELIQGNVGTLRSLEIGQESQILRSNHEHNLTESDDGDDDDDGCKVLTALAVEDRLRNLSSLSILGLDVSPEQSKFFSKSIKLSCLRSLVLESCIRSAGLVQQLAVTLTTADGAGQVNLGLNELTFRHEDPDQRLVSALEGFLKNVNPLTYLSVLDNTKVRALLKLGVRSY